MRYLNEILEKRVTLIDYEQIRDQTTGRALVGSNKLAGFIGMYNAFRVLGEFLLMRRGLNNSFLHIGGSAYMHEDKKHCMADLERA